MTNNVPRRFIVTGVLLVILGLLTGLVSGSFANPRMGLSAHLEGLMNGTLLIVLGAAWRFVRLSPQGERWAFGLIAFAALANWLATLLAAIWGAGHAMMPIAAGVHRTTPWQEGVVSALLIGLSIAMLAGFALVATGLWNARSEA